MVDLGNPFAFLTGSKNKPSHRLLSQQQQQSQLKVQSETNSLLPSLSATNETLSPSQHIKPLISLVQPILATDNLFKNNHNETSNGHYMNLKGKNALNNGNGNGKFDIDNALDVIKSKNLNHFANLKPKKRKPLYMNDNVNCYNSKKMILKNNNHNNNQSKRQMQQKKFHEDRTTKQNYTLKERKDFNANKRDQNQRQTIKMYKRQNIDINEIDGNDPSEMVNESKNNIENEYNDNNDYNDMNNDDNDSNNENDDGYDDDGDDNVFYDDNKNESNGYRNSNRNDFEDYTDDNSENDKYNDKQNEYQNKKITKYSNNYRLNNARYKYHENTRLISRNVKPLKRLVKNKCKKQNRSLMGCLKESSIVKLTYKTAIRALNLYSVYSLITLFAGGPSDVCTTLSWDYFKSLLP